MQKGIIIFGICQLTKGALDIFKKNNLTVYGILDNEKKWHRTEIEYIPILGATDNPTFLTLLNEECASFIAYGDRPKRKNCLAFLQEQAKPHPISAIHPSAIIADGLQLGQGNYISAQVCIAPEVTLGNHAIVHSGVIIDSQTTIHDWVEIGPGTIIGHRVTIEEGVSIGMGARIRPGVTLCKDSHISACTIV